MSDEVFKRFGVLSYQRSLAVSDGLFYSRLADGTEVPLPVLRHGLRGTQNVDMRGKVDKDGTTKQGERAISQVQLTDTAKLDPEGQALVVRFAVRFLDLHQSLHAVTAAKTDKDPTVVARYRASAERFVKQAANSDGLREVSARLARNVANGRWLWRNRSLARAVQVTSTLGTDGGQSLTFDALGVPFRHFDGYSADEQTMAAHIAAGLSGEAKTTLIVEAEVDFGIPGAVEVFPSQSYLPDKPRGFARPLYCIGHASRLASRRIGDVEGVSERGQAALRDQKIGNALRTIDTWYPGYDSVTSLPIPIEPNGASLSEQAFFRAKEGSAFDLSRKLNVLDPDSSEGMYMLGMLIRGGVLSSAKE